MSSGAKKVGGRVPEDTEAKIVAVLLKRRVDRFWGSSWGEGSVEVCLGVAEGSRQVGDGVSDERGAESHR